MRVQKTLYMTKITFGILLHVVVKMEVITCDEIIDTEEAKTTPKNMICETRTLYILLALSLITIALLIAFSIYFWLIKCKARQIFFCHIIAQLVN